MKAKYRELTFKTVANFEKWLNATAVDKLELIDNGQDLLVIHIDEHGEILQTNAQGYVWIGKFVSLSELNENESIFMSGIGKDKISFTEMDFILEKRTPLIPTGSVNVIRKRGQFTKSTTNHK